MGIWSLVFATVFTLSGAIRFSAQLSLGCADYNVINFGASYYASLFLLENYLKIKLIYLSFFKKYSAFYDWECLLNPNLIPPPASYI